MSGRNRGKELADELALTEFRGPLNEAGQPTCLSCGNPRKSGTFHDGHKLTPPCATYTALYETPVATVTLTRKSEAHPTTVGCFTCANWGICVMFETARDRVAKYGPKFYDISPTGEPLAGASVVTMLAVSDALGAEACKRWAIRGPDD